jgi:hypothetical protein
MQGCLTEGWRMPAEMLFAVSDANTCIAVRGLILLFECLIMDMDQLCALMRACFLSPATACYALPIDKNTLRLHARSLNLWME